MIRIAFILSLVLLSGVNGYGANPKCFMNQAIRQKLLDAHNQFRNKVASGGETQWQVQPSAADMKVVSWDSELEHFAQSYAGRCPSGHRQNTNRVSPGQAPFGENLYWSWTSAAVNLETFDFTKAVKAWYNEVQFYPPNQIKPFYFSMETGHYSQVVWANSNRVGCGVSLCYDSGAPSYPNAVHVVCNYGPPGNYQGQGMYTVGKATCANSVFNSVYPALCGNQDPSQLSPNTVTSCPQDPTSSTVFYNSGSATTTATPTTTTTTTTAPAPTTTTTAPAPTTTTTTTTTAPAPTTTTTAPAPTTTTTPTALPTVGQANGNGWIWLDSAAWRTANPTHGAFLKAQSTAISALSKYGVFTVKSVPVVLVKNTDPNLYKLVVNLVSGSSNWQFTITTSNMGQGTTWYCLPPGWSASSGVKTDAALYTAWQNNQL